MDLGRKQFNPQIFPYLTSNESLKPLTSIFNIIPARQKSKIITSYCIELVRRSNCLKTVDLEASLQQFLFEWQCGSVCCFHTLWTNLHRFLTCEHKVCHVCTSLTVTSIQNIAACYFTFQAFLQKVKQKQMGFTLQPKATLNVIKVYS